MSAARGPAARTVRRAGLGAVGVAAAAGIAVGRWDLASAITLDVLVLVAYLTFCGEPIRRVIRTERVPWGLAGTYLATALAVVGFLFALPRREFRGGGEHTASVLSRLLGVDDLSAAAAGAYATATWVLFGLATLGTLALWGQVLRLARATRWRAIDHTVGDGSLATGATLAEPLGTSVTRPATGRPPRR